MEKSIKEIVGILRMNALFVTMWDILQLSAPRNLVLPLLFFQSKRSYVIPRKPLPSTPT